MAAPSYAPDAPFHYHDVFSQLSKQLGEQYALYQRQLDSEQWVFEVPTLRRRTQLVHLILDGNRTGRNGETQHRLVILSPVGRVPRRLPAEMLLRRNATLNAGAICIVDLLDDQQRLSSHLAVRATRSLHAAAPSVLYQLLSEVATTADELERRLFAHDQL